MYSASAVSCLKRQAWGIRQALCSLFPHPNTNVYLSPDDASMQTQAAGHRETATAMGTSSVCRTMAHSARTPTTRPLPRPAAIASRHATSRAMQVTSALLVSQAATAALFTTQPMSLSLVHASPHARPYTATPIGEGAGVRFTDQRRPILIVILTNHSQRINTRDPASRDGSSNRVPNGSHTGGSMVTYQADSPSRMCVMVRLMRRPAWCIDLMCLVWDCAVS
jgi:hypothetical protein